MQKPREGNVLYVQEEGAGGLERDGGQGKEMGATARTASFPGQGNVVSPSAAETAAESGCFQPLSSPPCTESSPFLPRPAAASTGSGAHGKHLITGAPWPCPRPVVPRARRSAHHKIGAAAWCRNMAKLVQASPKWFLGPQPRSAKRLRSGGGCFPGCVSSPWGLGGPRPRGEGGTESSCHPGPADGKAQTGSSPWWLRVWALGPDRLDANPSSATP